MLAHVYRSGDDHIGYHDDEEAYESDVVSVSLGAERRFLVKNKRTEQVHEVRLGNGDLFHMQGPNSKSSGFQRQYKHCVPRMNVGDLYRHLVAHGWVPPSGRKTRKVAEEAVEALGVKPVRISFTFRRFED